MGTVLHKNSIGTLDHQIHCNHYNEVDLPPSGHFASVGLRGCL